MIKLQQIKTEDTYSYQYMEELLQSSFPQNEYRDLDELRFYTDNKRNFYCNVIYNDEKLIGLVNYWEFDRFFYIEHLAISASERNKHYGEKLLEYLKKLFNKPIILEVEVPKDTTSIRRVNFYQRHGFNLWEEEYIQPPYKSGENYLPLKLMALGNIDKKGDFEHIKATLYNQVYNHPIPPFSSEQPLPVHK